MSDGGTKLEEGQVSTGKQHRPRSIRTQGETETETSHSSTHFKIKHLHNMWVLQLLHQLYLHQEVLLRPRCQPLQLNTLYSNQVMRRTLQYTQRWSRVISV